MLRRVNSVLLAPSSQSMHSQQQILEINSAMSLLRMCYRSIDICVQSRHGRNFLKKRLIERWAVGRNETDPEKQRFLMDHAGAFLQALHTPKNPKPDMVVTFQLSRRQAYEDKVREQEEREKAREEQKKKPVKSSK